ncbi:MAG TPA: multiheme c-type cytochrome [Methylomirabilota bacterium]|nr:multiheme c-type cytochrome [Methylomirabilota bacterium]
MRPCPGPRPIALACALLLALPLALGGSRPVRAAAAPPDTLVVLGTADLKGKTSPCGCHIPKGGFARIAAFADSTRALHPATVYLDAGGSFPDLDGRTDLAEFMFRSLVDLHVGAVGVGPRDLRHGIAFLKDLVRRTGAPVTCANLVDKRTRLPLFPSGRVIDVGGVKVGVFALFGDRLELGPAADSLAVLDPENTANAQVTALRNKGAKVVVLLAQLGRTGGEDLVSAVPGIDAVVLGHDIPVYEKGRRIGETVASYAGEQGQHIGVIALALAADGHVADATCGIGSLGPEVREQPALLKSVKAFEDAYNERMRLEERGAALAAGDDDPVDHFVGEQVCARCHASESEQWRTTAHSLAWETLQRVKKDATPECIPCHVVGFREAGGFQTAARTPQLVNVQCENCHGMGTEHGSDWLERRQVNQGTCLQCHNQERDPEFDFAAKFPLIVHGNTSGESIRIVKARRGKGGMGDGQ